MCGHYSCYYTIIFDELVILINMKSTLLLYVVLIFSANNSYGNSDSTTISRNDFIFLAGCWKGTLTYRDYSTGKPFSMPAELKVDSITEKNFITCFIKYPKEPSANAPDTIFISDDGKLLNGRKVISVKKHPVKRIITETHGQDGNDNKPATIRHTYSFGPAFYTVTKEVKFKGTNDWIVRNEYKFTRQIPCNQ